jgi:hypothetical protein
MIEFIAEYPKFSVFLVIMLFLLITSLAEIVQKTFMWLSAMRYLAKTGSRKDMEDFVRETVFKKVDKNDQK